MYAQIREFDMPAPSTKVINFRAPESKQALIDHAAEVLGKSRTDFILDASCEKAREVLADQTSFMLDRETFRKFAKAIEAPLAQADAKALQKLLSQPSPWEG